MSKLDKYYRVIVNQNSNDFNDKPEYVIQTLFSDKTHLTKNQYKTGNGEWREFSKNNPIYSRLEDACSALIKKCCKDKAEQIRSLEEQLKNAIVPKFKIGQEVFYLGRDAKIYSYIIDHIEGLYFRYCDNNNCYLYEEDLFATKSEAEQRLAELKGETND